jgi:hypothetical protein
MNGGLPWIIGALSLISEKSISKGSSPISLREFGGGGSGDGTLFRKIGA